MTCVLERMWPNLRCYPGICLQALRKTIKNQKSQSLNSDLNLPSPKYKGVDISFPVSTYMHDLHYFLCFLSRLVAFLKHHTAPCTLNFHEANDIIYFQLFSISTFITKAKSLFQTFDKIPVQIHIPSSLYNLSLFSNRKSKNSWPCASDHYLLVLKPMHSVEQ